MKQRMKLSLALAAVVVFAGLFSVNEVMAQAPPVFSAKTLAKGTFGEIDIFRQVLLPKAKNSDTREGHEKGDGEKKFGRVWLSLQKTKGESDVYVQDNSWDPGAATTWHTHPGHSLIIVTQGTLTTYEGDDPECKPHVYNVGDGFVDEGGGHVHIIRNETGLPAKTMAVQLIPKGATRKTDVASPGNCPF